MNNYVLTIEGESMKLNYSEVIATQTIRINEQAAHIKELEKKSLIYKEAMLIRITSLEAEIKIMYDIKVP